MPAQTLKPSANEQKPQGSVSPPVSKIKKSGFNLVPVRFHEKKVRKSRLADINIYGGAAVFALIAVASALIGIRYYLQLTIQPRREEVAAKWNEIVAMRDIEWKARAIDERLDTLETLETEKVDLFGILFAIENRIDISFSWAGAELNKGVLLTAKVNTMGDAFKLLSQVGDMDSFESAWPESVTYVESQSDQSEYVIVSFTVYPESGSE